MLTSYKGLGRRALDDHIPKALDSLERRLDAEHAIAATEAEVQQRTTAIEHAEQRWQIGYHLQEVLREWGHLQRALLREVTDCASEQQFDPPTLCAAFEALGDFITEYISAVGARYVQYLQAQATGRVNALQRSLDHLQALENERAERLHEAAHDLRGSAAVVANVSALLEQRQIEGTERQRFYGLLQRRIQAMGELLTQLVVWARLETGRELPRIEKFDAAERLKAFCEAMQPIAEARGLYFKCDGPAPFHVEADTPKLQRIVQNLVINAIQATERGGITVRWQPAANDGQWVISIEDSGPGFDPRRKPSPQSQGQASQSGPQGSRSAQAQSPPELPQSEGIGLMIVERLCESLGANLQFESAPGHGTTVRVTLPLTAAISPAPSIGLTVTDDAASKGTSGS